MLKILIVDAVPRDAVRLLCALESQGFEFFACRVETLEALRSSVAGGRPDLVLSEINIRGADGFRALEAVRERYPDVPFVFVSQTHNPGMIVEIFENGGNGHVSKHRLSELREVIHQAQHSCMESPAVEELLDAPLYPMSDSSNTANRSPRFAGVVKPICPRCKRIGDLDGDWQPVEIHLRLHRRATVTLGTCPDCSESLLRL